MIDARSSYRQKKFLAAMRTAQFSQLDYHYIVGNYVGSFCFSNSELYQELNELSAKNAS